MGRLLTWLLLALPTGTIAQPAVLWTTNYYPVTGATLREVHQSLRQNRPWKNTSEMDGYTRWRIEWHFSVSSSGNKCRLTSFNTRTTVAITLPRWTTPTNATDDIRAAWQRYITALGQHETGHGQIALAAAGEIQKRARESGEDPDCAALKQKINSLCQSIVEQYRIRDKDYDERTRHGATQGAVLQRRERDERR
jgi:predicted secreted Zn-dependent protease